MMIMSWLFGFLVLLRGGVRQGVDVEVVNLLIVSLDDAHHRAASGDDDQDGLVCLVQVDAVRIPGNLGSGSINDRLDIERRKGG